MTDIIHAEAEVIKTPTTNKKFTLRLFTIIGVIVLLLVLIFYKISNPDFQIRYVVFIGGGVLILGTLIFFFFNIFSKYQKALHGQEKTESGGIPTEASEEQLLKKINKVALSRQNHIRNIVSVTPFSLGHNSIYAYKVKLVYKDILGDVIYIIVNANYLDIKPTAITSEDTTYSKLKQLANGLSSSPEETPEIEQDETYDPITGRVHTHKKTTPVKKETNEKIREEIK